MGPIRGRADNEGTKINHISSQPIARSRVPDLVIKSETPLSEMRQAAVSEENIPRIDNATWTGLPLVAMKS